MRNDVGSITKEEQGLADLLASAAARLDPLPPTRVRPGTARRVFQLAEAARALAKESPSAPEREVRLSEWVERAARFLRFKDPLRAMADVLDEITPQDTYISHPDDPAQWASPARSDWRQS